MPFFPTRRQCPKESLHDITSSPPHVRRVSPCGPPPRIPSHSNVAQELHEPTIQLRGNVARLPQLRLAGHRPTRTTSNSAVSQRSRRCPQNAKTAASPSFRLTRHPPVGTVEGCDGWPDTDLDVTSSGDYINEVVQPRIAALCPVVSKL